MNYHSSLNIGSLLVRPKFFGIVQHEGIVVGFNAVLHNTPDKGEHLSTLEEFAAGESFQVRSTEADPAMVITRAKEILADPQRYDALLCNCQHTTSKILRGIAKSPWVAVGIIIALIIGAIVLAPVMFGKR